MATTLFRYEPAPPEASPWEQALGVHGGSLDLLEQVEAGLSPEAFHRFSDLVDVPRESLAGALHTTTRTVARRKRAGRPLDRITSERLVRLALLYKQVDALLRDETLTHRWMTTPRSTFAGRTPFEMAASEIGAREVDDLLLRIEHGVFH